MSELEGATVLEKEDRDLGNQIEMKKPSEDAKIEMSPQIGPHPGHIKVSRQYYFEYSIRRKLSKPGVDPTREEEMRIKGVQNILELKQELLLYVK